VLFEKPIKVVMLLHAFSLQPDVGAGQMVVLVSQFGLFISAHFIGFNQCKSDGLQNAKKSFT